MGWIFYVALMYIEIPVLIFAVHKKQGKWLTTLISGFLVILLGYTDWMYSGGSWIIYTLAPLVVFAVSGRLGRKARQTPYILTATGILVIYYILLNILLTPNYPWSLYTTYGIVIGPMIAIGLLEKRMVLTSVLFTGFSGLFFWLVNWLTTPLLLWYIYPLFAIGWWPFGSIYAYLLKAAKRNTLQKN